MLYGVLAIIAAVVAYLHFAGVDAPAAGEQWVHGRTAQDQPVAVMIDGEGVPTSYKVSFSTTCDGAAPYSSGENAPVTPATVIWRGDRLEGTEKTHFDVPRGSGTRVVRFSAMHSKGAITGVVRATDTWNLHGGPTTTCVSGTVPFAIAAP